MSPGGFLPATAPSRAGRHIISALRERWPLVPGLALALALVGAGTASLLPDRYRGQALVRVEWADGDSRPKPPADRTDRRRAALWEGVLDRSRLERLLEEVPAVVPLPSATTSEAIGAVVEGLDLAPGEDDGLWVRFVHSDPGFAVLVPNALVRLLIEDTAGENAEPPGPDSTGARGRLLAARSAMDSKEQAVLRMRERRLGTESSDSSRESTAALRSERRSLSASLAIAETREARLRARGSGVERREGTPSQLQRLRAQLAELRQRYTDQHPDVEALLRRIREEEARAPAPGTPEGGSSVASQAELVEVEREIQALRERIAEIDLQVAAEQPRSSSRPPVSNADLAAAERELARAREDYATALRDWEEEREGARLRAGGPTRFALIEPARVPIRVGPGALTLALLGAAIGFVLGVSIAVVAESRDDRIKGPEDVEALFAKPLLAAIPDVSKRRFWPRMGR